jgi:protein-S-isoprenylcysteine O-methyltransferase Ste14
MSDKVLLSIFLLACLSSFTWAVRKFFVKPEQKTRGLRITLLAGFSCAIANFAAIALMPEPKLPAVLLGVALYCLSLAIFWWTIASHRSKPLAACFSKDEQLHLVQHGPYRFMRHPFYCSYLLTWSAGAVATLNIWLAGAFVGMFVLYLTAAREEEKKFASSNLGDAYASYCSSTGQFFPNPLKLMTNRRLH